MYIYLIVSLDNNKNLSVIKFYLDIVLVKKHHDIQMYHMALWIKQKTKTMSRTHSSISFYRLIDLNFIQ